MSWEDDWDFDPDKEEKIPDGPERRDLDDPYKEEELADDEMVPEGWWSYNEESDDSQEHGKEEDEKDDESDLDYLEEDLEDDFSFDNDYADQSDIDNDAVIASITENPDVVNQIILQVAYILHEDPCDVDTASSIILRAIYDIFGPVKIPEYHKLLITDVINLFVRFTIGFDEAVSILAESINLEWTEYERKKIIDALPKNFYSLDMEAKIAAVQESATKLARYRNNPNRHQCIDFVNELTGSYDENQEDANAEDEADDFTW